jgi:hypothetical protein
VELLTKLSVEDAFFTCAGTQPNSIDSPSLGSSRPPASGTNPTDRHLDDHQAATGPPVLAEKPIFKHAGTPC